MKKINFSSRVLSFVGSELFFRLIVGLLVVQALWIALSASYPMAFDEDFHFGIIRLYAHHLSPFWSSNPTNGDAFGPVARDPSYLYHYLMSFPYRLISLFTDNQVTQVIFLRLLNIALFAASLPLFRRLLLLVRTSRTVVHTCLAVFVLVPIVPLLAGQINYDNLFIPLTALVLLLTLQFVEELSAYKRINTKKLLQLIALCFATSLVKYAFLPIFMIVALFVSARLIAVYRKRHRFWISLAFGVTLMGRYTRWWLLLAVVVALGLFWQRIGNNVIHYHSPIPDCAQVLSVQRCSAYGPWLRDYNFAQTKTEAKDAADTPRSIVGYSNDWLDAMWLRSYFAVDGPRTTFETRGPFLLPAKGALLLAWLGAILLSATSWKVWRKYDHPALWLFIFATLVYVTTLWLNAYSSFLQTGQPVGINGRYLLPVLPMILVVVALGYVQLLKQWPKLGVLALLAVLLCLSWGGGTLTYILRSNDTWYWNSRAVQSTNHAVKRVVAPLVPGSNNPTAYLP